MGYNGRECILRALCETSQFFGKKGTTMVKELLRTAFRYVTQTKNKSITLFSVCFPFNILLHSIFFLFYSNHTLFVTRLTQQKKL